MVNGTATVASVRRREIVAADLPTLVALFASGFPARPIAYWGRGLERMARRADVPPGCPRFGYLLEAEGRPVGALLMLFRAGEGQVVCNLSSWTVAPAYRMHAPMLVAGGLGRRDATFVNLSPAPHTWPIVEAQGFAPLPRRIEIVLPGSGGERGRVVFPRTGGFAGLPEATLLDDHLGYGCRVALVAAAEGPEPFVFLPLRIRSGRIPLPLAQLVYCRDVAQYRRFSGALGLALARRGAMGVVIDGTGPPTLWNRLLAGGARRKYVRGPHLPRTGDLAYTERVIFGP